MSKQGNSYSASINLKLDESLMHNLFHSLSYNLTSDDRVKTRIKLASDRISISINANDFNMLLAVNNSIMQSIKMLETINMYE